MFFDQFTSSKNGCNGGPWWPTCVMNPWGAIQWWERYSNSRYSIIDIIEITNISIFRYSILPIKYQKSSIFDIIEIPKTSIFRYSILSNFKKGRYSIISYFKNLRYSIFSATQLQIGIFLSKSIGIAYVFVSVNTELRIT